MWYKKYAVEEYMCQAKENIKDSWWCTAINDLQYGNQKSCRISARAGKFEFSDTSLFSLSFSPDIKTWAIVVVILLSLFLVFDLIALFGTSKVRTLSIDVSWQRGGKRSKKSRSFWAKDQQKKRRFVHSGWNLPQKSLIFKVLLFWKKLSDNFCTFLSNHFFSKSETFFTHCVRSPTSNNRNHQKQRAKCIVPEWMCSLSFSSAHTMRFYGKYVQFRSPNGKSQFWFFPVNKIWLI